MPTFDVYWSLRIDADDMQDAVRAAVGERYDPESPATFYRVIDVETDQSQMIDADGMRVVDRNIEDPSHYKDTSS